MGPRSGGQSAPPTGLAPYPPHPPPPPRPPSAPPPRPAPPVYLVRLPIQLRPRPQVHHRPLILPVRVAGMGVPAPGLAAPEAQGAPAGADDRASQVVGHERTSMRTAYAFGAPRSWA